MLIDLTPPPSRAQRRRWLTRRIAYVAGDILGGAALFVMLIVAVSLTGGQ
jgi:hypothetical protein